MARFADTTPTLCIPEATGGLVRPGSDRFLGPSSSGGSLDGRMYSISLLP